MNTSILRFIVPAVLVLLFAPTSGAAPETPTREPLKVRVEVPASPYIVRDEDIRSNFMDIAVDVLRTADSPRRITAIGTFDSLSAAPYLLTIRLSTWRINHFGDVECSFFATLKTPAGFRTLGNFSTTEIIPARTFNRFTVGDAFIRAAESAVRNLRDTLVRTEALTRR